MLRSDQIDRLIDLVSDYPGANAARQMEITDAIIDLLGMPTAEPAPATAAEPAAAPSREVIAVDPASIQATAAGMVEWLNGAAPTGENVIMGQALVDAVWAMRPKLDEDREAARRVSAVYSALQKRAMDSDGFQAIPDFLTDMVAGGQVAYTAKDAAGEYEKLKARVEAAKAKYAVDQAAYRAKIAGRLTEIRARLDELRRIDSQEATDEFIALRNEWNALANNSDAYDEMKAVSEQVNAEIKTLYAGYGRRFMDEMLAASPVSAEQAKAWADSQIVDESALERIARYGYKKAQLRADMAEFYRLCGGRLASVNIENQSRRRANAGSIHGHSDSIIRVGTQFNKRVLFHEMAHHLEADPQLLMAAKAFLVKRRESDKAYKLRALTGNKRYGTDELAYKDSWFDEYVGKLYPDATEVFSMGMESFYDLESAGWRASLDPEMMALQIGAMKQAPHPAAVAVKNLRAGTVAAKRESDEQKAATFEQLVSEAAGFVTLRDVPEPEQMKYWAYTKGFGGPKAKYLGEWNGRYFYSSPAVRNRQTKRRGRGFIVLWPYLDHGVSSHALNGDDLNVAKAEAWFVVMTGYYLDGNDSKRLSDAIAEYRKRTAELEAARGS